MTSDIPSRYRHKGLILGICCLSLFIASMDATVVNVALPAIGKDLDSAISGLQWTIDAYTLVLASLLVLSGSVADRIGRRRTFQLGLALFSTGSLLCSVAPSVGALVAFRMVQAVGGSMLNPVALSIITATFADPRERARAVGVWGAVVGISLGFGPLIGGALTESVGWRAIFWINVPVGLAAIVLTALFVPESRGDGARRFDPVGQFLVILLLATLVAGLIEGPNLGWSSPRTILLFVVSAVALAGILGYEPRREQPLLDLRFFRSVPFSSAFVTALCVFGAQGAFLFLTAFYLQEFRGFSPFQAGLRTLPLAALQTVAAPLAGRLVSSAGTRLPLAAGAGAIAAATVMLTTIGASTPMPFLLVVFALLGLGFGLVNPPITTTAVSGMPGSRAGVAAAIASMSRQTGVSLGVAIAGSVAGVSGTSSVGPSFAQSTHAVWWISTALAVVVFVLAFVANSEWAKRSTASIAHLIAERGTNAIHKTKETVHG